MSLMCDFKKKLLETHSETALYLCKLTFQSSEFLGENILVKVEYNSGQLSFGFEIETTGLEVDTDKVFSMSFISANYNY